ncbi:hypothetical protein M407DRAFT_146345 [Tulasnella calospora MUT 4182]|uniref:Uncharacterized protein n=1 Tax=Tulasnella calospora MUT 4182 TaxID=1051891 RepID=A0A0C3Q7R2_9AGAM|nr:hypothetical protein M407DRAFT_146345 [Tulasnella calospora MUT 4182]
MSATATEPRLGRLILRRTSHDRMCPIRSPDQRFFNALMQENKEHAPSPPYAPGSDQGDSSSVFLHSSKLRNKLEKLARWRIDPSLIAFSGDAREFRGGFATVSQAFLAPRSSANPAKSDGV